MNKPILDCGDHSCRFAENKSGQRTNGGCRCLSGMSSKERLKVETYILGLRVQNARLRELVEEGFDEGACWCKNWDESRTKKKLDATERDDDE